MTRNILTGSEAIFPALIDAAPDGIVIVNQEGRNGSLDMSVPQEVKKKNGRRIPSAAVKQFPH